MANVVIDPLANDLIHEVDTTGVLAGAPVDCVVQWVGDHPHWTASAAASHVDDRRLAPVKYFANDVTKGANQTDVDWRCSWAPHEVATWEMEIFAVIRAEYRFIKDNDWQKVKSKKSSQGMDSLFKTRIITAKAIAAGNAAAATALAGGAPPATAAAYGDSIAAASAEEVFAICESKCTTDMALYNGCLAGTKLPLGKLGNPYPIDHASKKKTRISPGGTRQMSGPWLVHCFQQERVGTVDPTVKANLTELLKYMAGGAFPLRWMNVYGTASFYLVPGVYQSFATVTHLGPPPVILPPPPPPAPAPAPVPVPVTVPLDNIQCDFPDNHYLPYEFFALDAATAAFPGITGAFHDASAAFAAIEAAIKLNPGAYGSVVADNKTFFS